MLRITYTVFIGVLLAIFVGYGIATFYSGPAQPKAPDFIYNEKRELSPQEAASERAYNEQLDSYNNKMTGYNRNVALLAMGGSVVFVALGLLFARHLSILADGLMLGGVFVLIYALGRSFAAQSNKFSFVMVCIALVFTGILGYLRFAYFPRHSRDR